MQKSKWIWMNGSFIAHDDAKLHVSSTALHFGPNVFEGIRCHRLGGGRSNIFRLGDHVDRLFASARALRLTIPFSPAEIAQACVDTVRKNGQDDAYIRILAFPGAGTLGFGRPGGPPAETCVLSFPWHNGHLEDSQKRGIRLHVSSVIRTQAHPLMSKSKLSANYPPGLMAIYEARDAGCDDALLLDHAGAVAEASTANVFAVWGEHLATPPTDLPILAGITRDTLLVLGRELGLDVSERTFDVRELASASEVFLSGTTAEITPVREIDGRKVSESVPGPITQRLLNALHGAIRSTGPDRGWAHWTKTDSQEAS